MIASIWERHRFGLGVLWGFFLVVATRGIAEWLWPDIRPCSRVHATQLVAPIAMVGTTEHPIGRVPEPFRILTDPSDMACPPGQVDSATCPDERTPPRGAVFADQRYCCVPRLFRH